MTKEDVEFVLRVLGEIRKTKGYKTIAEDRLFHDKWSVYDRLIDFDFDNLAEAQEACREFNIMCDIFDRPEKKVVVYYFTNMNHKKTYRIVEYTKAHSRYENQLDEDGNVNGDLQYKQQGIY